MVVVLYFFALLEFIGGIGVFAGSKSAIHEILGTLAIGFSIMTAGLAAILTELQRGRRVLEKQVSANTQGYQKVLEKALPPEPANTQKALEKQGLTPASANTQKYQKVLEKALPPEPANMEIEQRLKAFFAIFATPRGHIVLLQDGRLLSIVGANSEFVPSMEEYRRAYQDNSQWQELTTAQEKQRFWSQVAPVVRKILENQCGD